ncbi:MAG: YbbR domain pair protein [Gemmatimonadetes bacterium]|nr:YbbR domain pair protein [Gemmatimonadota bacterium]
MRRWHRRITANWGLKLAALALAVLLWVVVSAEQVTSQWLEVPVAVVLRDARLRLDGAPVPARVSVRFTGSGRDLWELSFRRPVLSLPVREVSEAGVYGLDPGMVGVPGRLAVTAQDVRPGWVRLSLRRLAVREVPVRVRWAGGAGEGVRVSPARVVVMGDADRVARLDSLVTRPVSVASSEGEVDRDVELDLARIPGIHPDVSRVRVTGRVVHVAERVLPAVSVDAPADAIPTPSTVSARLTGSAAALASVDPSRLRARVYGVPRPLPASGAEAPLRIDGLPDGVAGVAVPSRTRLTRRPGSTATGGAPAVNP